MALSPGGICGAVMEFLTRPKKTGPRYPHLPGSAGHSSPKKPAGLRRKPDLALYPAGATLRGAV